MFTNSFRLLFAAGLICGSINSIALKLCYQTSVLAQDGSEEQFQKPWFFSTVMFLACLVALPVYYGLHFYQRFKQEALRRRENQSLHSSGTATKIWAATSGDEHNGNLALATSKLNLASNPDEETRNYVAQHFVPLLDESADGARTTTTEEDHSHVDLHQYDPVTAKLFFALIVPSICDLLGTSLQQMGLCVTTVSVFQMLKGSILLFSAFLSVWFLEKRLTTYNWIGILLCLLALSLVGVSSVLAAAAQEGQGAGGVMEATEQQQAVPKQGTTTQLIGIALILLGQVVCSAQYVIEEYLLRPPHNVTPMAIVGLEGFWGSSLMIFLVLPICSRLPGVDAGGEYENTQDSLFAVAHSPFLQAAIGTFFVSVLLYNILGLMVTAESSAIHHTFLDASRTLVIWVASVVLYYTVGEQYGEPLTVYSPVQALGFAILILGQLAYEGVVRFPCVEYNNPGGRVEDDSSALYFTSPLTHDPLYRTDAPELYCSPHAFTASPADRWRNLSPSPATLGKVAGRGKKKVVVGELTKPLMMAG
ncbi:unnamed protein product [Amoebophrya sp. A120]|nr:unnamed protein product [Amoebophrya sp. A120]|eukprot:GSA120T00005968001.1